MRPNILVYISGPMTAKHGRTIEENVAAGVRVYLELLTLKVPCYCPHLSGAFPSAWTALSHADWLAYDCAIIDRCTHMLMMPGWTQSTGAQLEHDYAIEHRVPIYYSVEGLMEALAKQETTP